MHLKGVSRRGRRASARMTLLWLATDLALVARSDLDVIVAHSGHGASFLVRVGLVGLACRRDA